MSRAKSSTKAVAANEFTNLNSEIVNREKLEAVINSLVSNAIKEIDEQYEEILNIFIQFNDDINYKELTKDKEQFSNFVKRFVPGFIANYYINSNLLRITRELIYNFGKDYVVKNYDQLFSIIHKRLTSVLDEIEYYLVNIKYIQKSAMTALIQNRNEFIENLSKGIISGVSEDSDKIDRFYFDDDEAIED